MSTQNYMASILITIATPTRQNNTYPTLKDRGENSNLNIICDQDERLERKENIWVKNLSASTLTKDQIKALAHGPNYAIVPRSPPVGEYITAIENVCNQLQQGKVEELRGEIKSVLKNICTPRPNITREERKAIDELRKDETKMILTADKGVSMVVLNRMITIRRLKHMICNTHQHGSHNFFMHRISRIFQGFIQHLRIFCFVYSVFSSLHLREYLFPPFIRV